ncbi:MAG: aminotransferase class V-fold PLP-dependent enzyme, partial [candidate division WOR-3 bacterium]
MNKLILSLFLTLFVFCGGPQGPVPGGAQQGPNIAFGTLTEGELQRFIKVLPTFIEIVEKEGKDIQLDVRPGDIMSAFQGMSILDKQIAALDSKLRAAGMGWNEFWPAYAKTMLAYAAIMLDSIKLEIQKSQAENQAQIRQMEELLKDPKIPEAQKNIAEILALDYPEQIAFAPNTHEFVFRLITCFDWFKKLKILSTDSEFHSFARQTARLEEAGKINVNRVETFPFESFLERFLKEIEKSHYDIVFLSNVFFNSGFYVKDLTEIVQKTSEETMIVIDGYHSFMAIPLSIREYESRIFFLGGGYKYAMSGEGVCFMFAPKNNTYRPIQTGWFATFGSLTENQSNLVAYSNDAYKFWGSTFDPTGIYRFNYVCKLLNSINLDVANIHHYVINLQNLFLDELKKINSDVFNLSNLLTPVTD